MSELYREIILEEYKHPRNKGHLETPTVTNKEVNTLCGDVISLDVKIENDVIVDIAWSGTGCAISQASASLFTEEIKGKTVAEVEKYNEKKIISLLGIEPNPARMKCAVLIMKTLANALTSAEQKTAK